MESLLKVLGNAATHPNLATVVEDYVIFHVEALSQSLDIAQLCSSHRRQIAQILRAEHRPLSEQEVEDALSARTSYGIDDVVIIDWNAALLIDRDGDDVREVLQFANVELLEMRYLDQKLDGALDTSYDSLTVRGRGKSAGFGARTTGNRRVAGGQCHPLRRREQRTQTFRRSVPRARLSHGEPAVPSR